MKTLQLSFVIALGFIITPGFGQKATKRTTKEICQCMDKIDATASVEVLNKASEDCITKGIMNNIQGLIKEYKIKEDDNAGTEKMGEAIGLKLVEECESSRNIFLRMEGAK